MITRKELIKKHVDFFKSKGHTEIKNSSLLPENDPSVLFTTAGMHPLIPYLLGEIHPQGKRLVNVQRCIRTCDIDEVGDNCHHTFFEMLGNWSLGDYFKKEAIEYTFEFLTKELKIPIERLAISCFKGDSDAPRDDEAAGVWMKLGISRKRIVFLGKKDNWWEIAGPGPCGPDTEIFYWTQKTSVPEGFDVKDKRWVEIGNDVLMQYKKDKEGKYHEAKQKNIDFGGGVERIVTVLNGLDDNYLSGMWKSIIEVIEKLSKKNYKGNEREMRIIADHVKASVFIIADGVVCSNIEQGYILRRLIRRAIMNMHKLGLVKTGLMKIIAEPIFLIYNDYEHLQKSREKILRELNNEEEKFEKTLEKGLKEFEKMCGDEKILGKEAFLLCQSYGFPLEMTVELAEEKGIKVDKKGFECELKKHQDLSRTASAGKFKSGLADESESTKKLHTATHLLNEALRVVLDKPDLYQKGSNITPERLRFDFNFDRKLTSEELKEVEDLVNLKIQSNLSIVCKTMPLEKAKDIGAKGVFEEKYDSKVKVYHIGSIGDEFSKEICAGPHVNNTSELGHFKIIKEESSSSGVRRIKAVLE